MPDRTRTEWWPRALERLLPRAVARDLFHPAWQDLRHVMLTHRLNAASSRARAWFTVRYAGALLMLLLDCWRLSLWNVLSAAHVAERQSVPPSLSTASIDSAHFTDANSSARTTRKEETLAVLLYHLKHACRRLLHEPGFTIAAALTLALGVGANTSVFAVIEAVLLRPLPYSAADRLVMVRHRDPRTSLTKNDIGVGDYVDMARDQRAFSSFVSYSRGNATITSEAEPISVSALLAGPQFLETMGMQPVLGRTLTADDTRENAAPVMLLGETLWRQQYHGDPAMVGRSITFGKSQVTVVGIAPAGFRFPPTSQTDVIFPNTVPTVAPTARHDGWMYAIARLGNNVTLADAERDLARLSTRMAHDFPMSNQASSYYAVPLRDAYVGDTKQALTLLLAAVGVVLLIACANVANLLLARSLGRRREMAVKVALGAGRRRLALQLLAESLVLATVSGAAGVAVAHWGSRALVALIPNGDNIPGLADVHLNGMVLGFALAITVVTTLLFALVSILAIRAEDGTGVLAVAGRATMSATARRATSGLVAAEIALAIMLLVGAGLITRSFSALLHVNPGFSYDNVATLGVRVPAARFPEGEARRAVYVRLLEALKANPAVRDAGFAAITPLTGNNWTSPFIRADVPVPAGEQAPEVGWQVASQGYFKALQIPLVAGRLFDAHDSPDAPPVVIVSEAIQKRFFPNASAIGQQIRQDGKLVEIVGVVGNIRRAGLTDDPRADLYMPFERSAPTSVTLFAHTRGNAEEAIPVLKAALKSVEPGVVLRDARTLADIAGESMRSTRLMLWLLGVFAATALTLAAIGIYGVMSYVVRQRTREIGTRIALGATRGNILWLVMKQGTVIACAGTAAGLGAGLVATRLLGSVLYNVSPTDPLTMTTAASVLMVTSMLACYVPARRATTVDPARTLTEA